VCLDAFSPQRIQDPVAGRIRTKAADPGRAQPETRESDARVALGPGVVDAQRRGGPDCLLRRRDEREHRFSKRDEVVIHLLGIHLFE
jgi:hypothetical protein